MARGIDRKSTSSFVALFAGGAVSWQSKLQKCIALSTTEAEYVATNELCKEMLWMKKFLQELGLKKEEYVVHCDSQSAIHLSKNSCFHSKAKHIDVRYLWIKNVLEEKQLKLLKVHTNDNGADMLTKPLSKEKQELCRRMVGEETPHGA